jgi:hypothetical protein
MIEIENFLSEDICDYCVNYFRRKKKESILYKKRWAIDLKEETKDPIILKLVNKYSKIYPNYLVENMQLIFWPIGESHDWHDDTIYYHKTTITYLNKDYEGGRTTVKNYTIEPQIGKIVLFDSTITHKVSELVKGERYVIMCWYKNG